MISADGTARANAVKPQKSQHAAVVFRSWNASNSRSLAAAASFTTGDRAAVQPPTSFGEARQATHHDNSVPLICATSPRQLS